MANGTSRRNFVQLGFGGLLGTQLLAARRSSAAGPRAVGGFGRAKNCIVLFSWGGMSHLDTFDPKPNAGSDVRSAFATVETATPGIRIAEHTPELAKRMQDVALVRSVHHQSAGHRYAAYWNLTGHRPQPLSGPALPPSRDDWPSLGSMVAFARENDPRRNRTFPGTFSLPYPVADRGILNGQYAGMLGIDYDPVYVKPKKGAPYAGVSPDAVPLSLDPVAGVTGDRIAARRELLARVESTAPAFTRNAVDAAVVRQSSNRDQAFDLVSGGAARDVFDLSLESEQTRQAYGEHVCGQSVLTARRLVDAGVPLVTVYCGAGDLNGGQGAHWDTHGNGYNRLKNDLLPPLDQASGALLDDLKSTGKLDETLVVWFTEFGRTPKLSPGGGRNHFPSCYSVAFAGGGIRGGQVYGSSDKIGSEPASGACGPEELHATVFHALGIDRQTTFDDLRGRPRFLCEADPLPLF